MSTPPPAGKVSFSFGKKPAAAGPATAKPTGFSLPKPPQAKASAQPRPSAFSLGGDDDDVGLAASEPESSSTAASSWRKPKVAARDLVHQAVKPSRSNRMETAKALDADAAAFAYDEVWDEMDAAKRKARERKEDDAAHRAPKYMGAAIASAATRKLDRLRAEEKMLEREREAEGDEFADKDKFVTQAYKDQMAEVRKAEEEEKEREAKLKKSGTSGMAAFYKQMLDANSAAHVAAVEASTAAATAPANLTIQKPKGPVQGPQLPDTTIEDARKAGLNVETNDSGELVDELSILAPGLNRMPKEQPLSLLGNASGSGSGRGGGQLGGAPYKSQRVGAAASTREVRERQERLIRDQLADEQLRLVKEQEERERAREIGVKEKRNDDSTVNDAKARYEERKRRKLEEAEAEKKRKEEEATAAGGK